jgi:thioredoxin 1
MLRAPLLLLAVLAVSSCDQAKDLMSKAKQVKPPAPSATPDKPDIRDISESEFAEFIQTPDKLVIVDYHADWCGPCKMLAPVLKEVAGEYAGRAVIGKINVDQAQALSQKEGVSGIPHVRFYRDGKRVDEFVGFIDVGQVRNKFAKHAPATAPAPKAVAAKDGQGAEGTPAPAAPPIQPMKKDWLPPGVERR